VSARVHAGCSLLACLVIARRQTLLASRAKLSDRALAQIGDFPATAFDALISTMSAVAESPEDPLRTFPTSDP
jgi:hypothetical protein